MKAKKILKGTTILLLLVPFLWLQCTHDDQEIPETTPPDLPSVTDLISARTSTPPSIDGVVDAVWDGNKTLVTIATVPEPGNDVFKGYVGDAYTVSLRSMYDDNNIYFLAEWLDKNLDFNRQTWYFDPGTSRWKQESRVPTWNSQGRQIRDPFYEDKFAFLWNVNNSVATWDAATCWSSCHTDVGEAGGYARHYTNPGETIDMWHWKGVRTNVNNQADDQFQNDTQPNGRHGDDKESGGYTDNKQELVIAGGDTVIVPKYYIPNLTYYYWITQDEIDAGTAKLITAVDANGVLSWAGGTINPNTDLAYQRDGSTTGAKGIPSIYTTAFVGNRGDLTAYGSYTGSGWVLEWSRKLSTGETAAQDVDFSDRSDQPFGIGVFDNAGIAHAIKPNLLLKFE